MHVWEVVPRPTHQKVIGARRVDTNNGDSAKPVYRSRYVAKKLKAKTVSDFFAAMPPLASLKMLMALATTKAFPRGSGKTEYKGETHLLSFVDVKRAHFCSPATREAYAELPDELGLGPGKVGRLLRGMYGCSHAGLNWELTVAKRIKAIGFAQ